MQEYLDYFNKSQNTDIQYISKFIKSKAIDKGIPVLICGSTGTGKEIVARLLHKQSSRDNRPLVIVNCSQIPESLFDSMMFGYVKGSFTGASQSTDGYFGTANNGTLYLDEVDSLPKTFQVKLLRALENQEFYRVGASVPTKVNVNIIASFGKSPNVILSEGIVREDLFYRLAGVVLILPSLQERPEDIGWFVNFYTKLYSKKYKKNITFLHQASEFVNSYSWPGNIRELKSLIERLFVLEQKSDINKMSIKNNLTSSLKYVTTIKDFNLQKNEDDMIIKALNKTELNQTNAAELLGISTRSLNYKIQALRKVGHLV